MLQNSNTIQPKVVVIRRRANQGFGFTLRHFIAYPPEDDPSWPQEASDPYQVKAMETIFIKEVQPNGPAHYANLQTGDRVLMVNNTPIAGIAYSTIVSMIKMTPSVLTLHVVPKECDVLQMHYTSIAHTPESNRLTTITIPKPLTVGNGNVAGALIPLNSSAATTTTKAFPQQQLISYHPLPSHAVLDSGGAVVSGGGGGGGGGNTSRSSSITSNSSGLRSLTPAAGAGGNSSANGDFNEYQQSLQQHGALLMRGDGGFMRSQAPQNITVLTRQQPQQQLQNPNTIYAAANSADTSDLMIRLRESIKQKEEFLKSPLPQASQHQQQQQQQHFFPQHTPPPSTSTVAQSHSNSSAQLPMVSGAASSSNAGGIARGQVRTLVKQPLPISACSSATSITSACGSSTGATKDLLPASCDMQNFYAKNLPANFDIAMMSRGGLQQHHGGIMKPSTRNRQRSLMTSGNSNIPAWDRYSPKELDYLESLPETGVTNQVFERKLVSHLAKGFDPFKPLSINTNATEVTALAAGSNNSNMAQLKKQPVLYDSLQHHPLHQSQQRQIPQPIPLRGCVVDGQQMSRMEIHKANLATTVDYPVVTKYSITAPEMAEKATLADIAETNDIPVPCTKSASTSTVTTEGVVRRYRPISSLHDDSKPMRRISYLRATNNENEYHPDTSQSTTATTATTAPTTSDVTLTVAAATLEASMKSKSLDEPTYEVVGTEREASQPVSLGGSRRASVNSEMRNSIHIESEFNGKMETKDVSTEMDVFETEMEIKSSCINGKRISEYRSWRQVKIEVKGDILKIYPSSRHTKSENNVIELDIRNFNILEEPVDKKKYIFRLQSKPQQQQPQHQQHSSSCLIASIANELTLEDANRDKLTSSGSSSSTSAAPLELQQQPQAQLQTDILFKTKSMTEMKRIYGLLQWKCSFIYDESDLQGKQLAEPQKTPATASVSTTTATYCDDNVQQQHHQLQLLQPPPEYSPLSSSASTSRCGELEVSDSISPVMKARKSSSHKNIPDKDLGSPKAKNWKDLLFRRGGGNHNADISPSSLASSAKTTGSIGVPLRSCPMSKNNEYVPIIVDICTEIVETKGLSIVGIYRIPGNKAAISELSDQVNKPDFSWDRCATDVRWEDVNVVSSLLKLFIRSLPDALLPSLFYINFIEADKKCGYVRLKELKELLESLPRHSYETMKHLIRHLTRVSKNCAVNLMEPKNLAIIFGPSIIRTPNDTLEIAVKDMKHQCRIVELLLTQYEYFFENGNTPDIADVSGNNMSAAASSSTSSTSQSQEEQTNMLLHNVSKIERLTTDRGEQTSSSSSKTSRFIPNLRRRTHSKRSAVSSDTYSGESVLSLDYTTNKMNATTTTTTSTSSNSSNTNNNNTTTASSSSSSFLSGKKNILGHHTTRIHHRKASLDEKDSGSGSGSSGKDLQQQQRNSVDISILLTDEESSNSRISDSGSMSLTTITDTLDSKLRNLRSGSESNDENDGSPEFQINRRHTFGQPLHLHSENIPYADESPERHYHHPHAAHSSCIDGSSPLMLSSSCSSSTEKETPLHQVQPQQQRSTVGGMKSSHNKLQHSATAPIPTTTLMSPPSTAASTPTAVVTVKTSKTIASNAAGSGIGLIGSNSSGRNLRFSSVYEQCCSEDDSEGSTTSDPKESSVIIASPASFFLDRYNKKRRDHRLFRSASFNCRNYSTRGGSGSSGTQNCNSSSALTKDEKTDMNLTKKRQIQNKQNRSIKRRHTVGGPHDYSNNGAGAGAGAGGGNNSNVVGAANNCNNQHCKHNAVGGGAGSTSGGSTSNNVTPSTTTTVLRRIPIPSANGNISNNQQQQQQQQQAHSHSHQQQVADRQQNNNNSNGAVVGEHVLEVGIRIKNINRSRY